MVTFYVSACELLPECAREDCIQGGLDFFGVFSRMNDCAYFDRLDNTVQG